MLPDHGSVIVQTARDGANLGWWDAYSAEDLVLMQSPDWATGLGAHLELSAEGAVWGTAA